MLPDHLGGHENITHLDSGILAWCIKTLEIKTMLDVGCGPGGMVELANSMGIDAIGVDGDNTIERYDSSKFIIHDFAESKYETNNACDLTWSCEFVEHVYEKYIPNYMPCFSVSHYNIISYAPPGFPGHHHVNCQPEEYWIDVFKDYGLIFDQERTNIIRKESTMNVSGQKRQQFMKNRGMFFENSNH